MWLTLTLLMTTSLPRATTAAMPSDLVPVVRVSGEPVFSGGGPASWDRRIRERGWILREKGGYRMWYTGFDGSETGRRMLGHARSRDGIHWQRSGDRPLHDSSWIEDVCVVKQGPLYYLFAEDGQHGLVWMSSRDGLAWRHRGPVVITTTDGKPVTSTRATPTVHVERGTWYLYYQNQGGVVLASTRDPERFRNVQDTPVLVPGAGAHERTRVATDQVIKHRGVYYMLYHATGEAKVSDKGWSTNLARSRDLVHWEPYTGNPVIADNKSSGIFVPAGRGYRLYTMHDAVEVFAPAAR